LKDKTRQKSRKKFGEQSNQQTIPFKIFCENKIRDSETFFLANTVL